LQLREPPIDHETVRVSIPTGYCPSDGPAIGLVSYYDQVILLTPLFIDSYWCPLECGSTVFVSAEVEVINVGPSMNDSDCLCRIETSGDRVLMLSMIDFENSVEVRP